jgi:hypothetical protein
MLGQREWLPLPTVREGGGQGQIEATTTKTPSALPPPTTDGVDRIYRQLAEIHTIVAVQLAECAR